MKKILLLSILLKISTFAAICQTSSFTFDGLVRQYIVHVPTGYNPTVSIPLVIALHNAYGSASDFLNTTGFNTLADNKNFMLVYPNGTGNPSSWNAGGCCYSAMNNNVKDIGFISALIDTLKSKYSIDSSKVYAIGFSNGGILAYRLGAELNDKIFGIASVSGPMMINTIPAKRRVPVIHFHALDDASVPFNGGVAYGITFPSVNSILQKWIIKDSCLVNPETLVDEQGIKGLKWKSEDEKSNIILYTSTTGGHSYTMNSKFPITDMIWEFFTTGTAHAKYTPTGIEDISINSILQLNIFPNPAKGKIIAEFHLNSPDKVKMELLNLSGRALNRPTYQNCSTGVNLISYQIYNSNISNGIYLIKLTSSRFSVVSKILMER